MPKFYQDKSNIHVLPDKDIVMFNKLPLGTYNISTSKNGIYLTHTDHIWLNDYKIYGKLNKDIEKIIYTFKSKTNSMGVLLSGTKGSGKTLVAREVSKLLYKEKYPTILITSPVNLSIVSDFLKKMKTQCVLIIDEFEKYYKSSSKINNEDERYSQVDILGLLDGLLTDSKILTILTCNNASNINDHMSNRPGRIYYHFIYNAVDISTVEEYCNDKLIYKEYINEIIQLRKTIGRFSFDILQAIVEEVNRYNTPPSELINDLNIFPSENWITYEITINYDNGNIAKTTQNGNLYDNKLKFYVNRNDFIKADVDPDMIPEKHFAHEFDIRNTTFISTDGYTYIYRCDKYKADLYITEQSQSNTRVRDLFDL